MAKTLLANPDITVDEVAACLSVADRGPVRCLDPDHGLGRTRLAQGRRSTAVPSDEDGLAQTEGIAKRRRQHREMIAVVAGVAVLITG